ncbi:MAG: squalene/phytoene synthase family protein [Candidatus Zixiibacteriota bacterium]
MSDRPSSEFNFALEKDFSEILTNPFLDIAARFWEPDRYEAFRVCYRSMRRIDDLVDDRKSGGVPISAGERVDYETSMTRWISSIKSGACPDPYSSELLATMSRFTLPLWPWERLCRAMIYDLHYDGFATFRIFLRYTEGAAVAPAAVFTHLCGVTPAANGDFAPPSYDIRRSARSLALFAYLVHIMRDFQKDQRRGLNYFADDLLTAHSIGRDNLRLAARSGRVPHELRALFAQYRVFCANYRARARATLDELAAILPPRYQLSLEVIYGLYSLVYERIDPHRGSFAEGELNPSPEEIQNRLSRIVTEFKARANLQGAEEKPD